MSKLLGVGIMLSSGSDTAFDLSTVMQSAVNSVQGDLLKVLGVVVPAIVLVTGAVVGVKFGLKWLRNMKSGS